MTPEQLRIYKACWYQANRERILVEKARRRREAKRPATNL
jgi:hypothetical protein